MKKLSILYKVSFLVILAAFFFTACDPDPVLTDSPIVTLVDEAGFLSADATISGTEDFIVKLSGTKGSGEMNSLRITRDGSQLDGTEFSIDGIAISNNPQLLSDGDRTSFVYEISITPHSSGTAVYEFEVTASDNDSGSASIEITIDDVMPTLTLVGPTSITLENPSFIELNLVGTQGSAALSTISVFEDGALITDTERLACNDLSTKFTANPNNLEEADKDGFDKSFFIRSSNEVGTKVYTITITDENLAEASVEYTITLEDLATPFSNTYSNVRIYNNSGPQPGAIDLDSGTNVSSSDGSADIVDLGLDGNGDWQRAIGPLGSTDLRSISATYESVTSRELLIDAYDAGTSLSETGELVDGSTYAAKINDDYYIFTVVAIVDVASNDDYMEFDIKQSTL